jgi:hypothetical protein
LAVERLEAEAPEAGVAAPATLGAATPAATRPPPLTPIPGLAGVVPFELAGGDRAAVWDVSSIPATPPPPGPEGAVVEATLAPPMTAPPAAGGRFTVMLVVVDVSVGFEQAAPRLRTARAAAEIRWRVMRS